MSSVARTVTKEWRIRKIFECVIIKMGKIKHLSGASANIFRIIIMKLSLALQFSSKSYRMAESELFMNFYVKWYR